MQTFWQDLRYGVRMLMKKPGFTLIAVITLALGIGASTAIFSIVDSVLLRPLPYPDAGRIVQLREIGRKGKPIPVTEPNYLDVRSRNRSLESIAQYAGGTVIVIGGSEPVRAGAYWVSGDFFDVLKVRPFAGRTFLPRESKPGGEPVAVISYGFWQQMLGGRSDFAGARLDVDGRVFTVVGVMPRGFSFPREAEIWVPREVEPPQTSRTAHNWSVIGRLSASVTLDQARREISGIGRQLFEEHGSRTDAVDLALIPLNEYLTDGVRGGLLVLMAAVGLLLLVACANVANLVLAQVTVRLPEFSIRSALGATRRRLARQFVIENLILALTASLLGIVISLWFVDLLVSLGMGNLPRTGEISVDARALLFSIGLSLLIALILGLTPLLRFSSGDMQAGLNESGRGQLASFKTRRLRSLLVVSQVAMTLVLLIGAGLLLRSFFNLLSIDPGFQTGNAIVMTLSQASTVDEKQEDRLRVLHGQLLDRIGRLPGVVAAGAINALPMTNRGANGTFLKDGNPDLPGYAEYRLASAGYFPAMGIRLLRGRLFVPGDSGDAPDTAVISRSLAQAYWPNEDPVGRTIQFGNMDGDTQLLHIVGIVSDIRDRGLDSQIGQIVYANSLQRPQWRQVTNQAYVVRAGTDPESLIPALRSTVRDLNRQAVMQFQTLEEVFNSSLDERRFSLIIFGAFAAVALLLAATGIYGVMAYSVTQRTQEIGVRMALGARARDVLSMIIGHGFRLIVAGGVIGVIGAVMLTRWLESSLHGISATDPATFAVVTLLLLVIGLLACYFPARRAAKVDPMEALRYQ
ncbi:MAG: ABC transporter permease [Acidobacteriota bacterium]|nr:MAG: ABC transporter permease [Acidobacteriota bacterium]